MKLIIESMKFQPKYYLPFFLSPVTLDCFMLLENNFQIQYIPRMPAPNFRTQLASHYADLFRRPTTLKAPTIQFRYQQRFNDEILPRTRRARIPSILVVFRASTSRAILANDDDDGDDVQLRSEFAGQPCRQQPSGKHLLLIPFYTMNPTGSQKLADNRTTNRTTQDRFVAISNNNYKKSKK